jgi:8-oxo-dGTP pyrophosphatase MutT (NUDIX family)
MLHEEERAASATGIPANGTIFPIAEAEYRVLPQPHPLYLKHEAEIAENWQREVAANPALYNGRLVFLRRLTLEGGRLTAEGHLVPYSTHLWWRKRADRSGGYHSYAWAVPISADGALLAIRMGPRTANPGLVYCAAGSLEAEDVVDGRVDIEGNMLRELKEETGLDGAEARPDPILHGLMMENGLLIFRVYRFGLSADEMVARVKEHMRHDHEQEIDAVLAIRSPDPDAYRYTSAMKRMLPFVLG